MPEKKKGGDKNNMRDSFVFYRSWHEAIKTLPAEVQGEIYTTIIEYGLYGNETHDMGKIASAIWTLIRPQMDANRARYESGCKGGAPRGSRNNPNGRPQNKPRTNQELTKNKPNDYEYDHENVNGDGNVACAREVRPPPPDFLDSDSENSEPETNEYAHSPPDPQDEPDEQDNITPFEMLRRFWNLKAKTSTKVKMSPITQLMASSTLSNRLMCRIEEYGEETLLIAIDRIEDADWWATEGKKLGVETFLKDDIFPKFLNREYGKTESNKR
jgi:hypothetical protein